MTLAAAGSSDPHLTSGDGPDPEYFRGLWWYQEPWLSTQALAVVVSQTQTWSYIGSHITMAPGWHSLSDWSGPGVSMALVLYHGLRCLTRPRPSTCPSVVTKTMDINTDAGCCRAMNPDMTLAADQV